MEEYEQALLTGDVEVLIPLLRRLVAQVTRSRRFPPGEGHTTWTNDAVDDLLADVLTSRPGRPARAILITALSQCGAQEQLERYLIRVIENFLKDQAKATTAGKLRNRLQTVLGKDERFAAVSTPSEGWGLSGGPQEWWQGLRGELLAAALVVRGVVIDQLPTAGPTPKHQVVALTAVSEAVLKAADGVVGAQDLAEVLVARFNLDNTPTYALAPLGEVEPASDNPSGAPESALDTVQAAAVHAQLSPEQRGALVQVADETTPKTRVARVLAAQVQEIVRRATSDDAAADVVLAELLRLCREQT